jgi:hypothetical protein
MNEKNFGSSNKIDNGQKNSISSREDNRETNNFGANQSNRDQSQQQQHLNSNQRNCKFIIIKFIYFNFN